MTTAADLGISEQEFQDAMNLEKIYAIVNKSGNRCAKCSNSVTHVDCTSFQFLCKTHAVGKGKCKKIGEERFTDLEVQKLQRRHGGGGGSSSTSRPARNASPPPVRSSHSDRHSRHRRSKSSHYRRTRSPSEESDPSAESEIEDYAPPPRSSHSRKSHSTSHQPQAVDRFATKFEDENCMPDMNFPTSMQPSMQQQFPPGMAGILMQRQQNQAGLPSGNFTGLGGQSFNMNAPMFNNAPNALSQPNNTMSPSSHTNFMHPQADPMMMQFSSQAGFTPPQSNPGFQQQGFMQSGFNSMASQQPGNFFQSQQPSLVHSPPQQSSSYMPALQQNLMQMSQQPNFTQQFQSSPPQGFMQNSYTGLQSNQPQNYCMPSGQDYSSLSSFNQQRNQFLPPRQVPAQQSLGANPMFRSTNPFANSSLPNQFMSTPGFSMQMTNNGMGSGRFNSGYPPEKQQQQFNSMIASPPAFPSMQNSCQQNMFSQNTPPFSSSFDPFLSSTMNQQTSGFSSQWPGINNRGSTIPAHNTFSSVQGIPNLTVAQKDWWD